MIDPIVNFVQVFLIASAGFFLFLAATDGRIDRRWLSLRRPSANTLDRLASSSSTLTPRTIRQTPLG